MILNSALFSQLTEMFYLLHCPGCKLPSKHLKLGVALKSLAGSRKVIEILNRYGYCANYHAVEQIKKELTFNVTEIQMETPNGMIACSKSGIRCAFDNFDRLVKSQSGKIQKTALMQKTTAKTDNRR